MNDAVSLKMVQDRVRFLNMLKRLDRVKGRNRRVQICAQSALFAVNHPCGILYSHEIERELQKIADTLPVPTPQAISPGRFLHIFTRAYNSGGHTRVCERWIKASPQEQTHDVVLTSQGGRAVPDLLVQAAKTRAGQVLVLSPEFPIEKAIALREMAQKYEAVILHVHGYDVVPMLAFGYEGFTRPVVFYNHADHLFWLGASIADLVINYRSETVALDQMARLVERYYVLPLPIDEPQTKPADKKEILALKKVLGFAEGDKIILSIASSYKFAPFAGLDYIEAAKSILAKAPDTAILVIGPDKDEKRWRDAWYKTGGRLNPIGVVPSVDLDKYIHMADLALESFPLGSPTALMEIARYGVPCIGLKTPVNNFDLFAQAGVACDTVPQLVGRALHELSLPTKPGLLYEILKQCSFPDAFRAELLKLYECFPQTHKRRFPEPRRDRRETAFEHFIAENAIVQRRRSRQRLESFGRWLADFYGCYLYPFGLARRVYSILNSYGLL